MLTGVFLCVCRRKSKQALRDYKKVLLQLETLEINVGDQCRKEFTGKLQRRLNITSEPCLLLLWKPAE